MEEKNQRMLTQIGIVRDLGYNLDQNSVILDLGCGNGNLVNEYRKNGYQAYGCDFEFNDGPNVVYLQEKGIIRKINTAIYKLPFEDNSIDFLTSEQVFEHVMDYSTTLSEIKRVLKPNGFSLHFFPSRYKVIEPHVYVPFASINQKYYWLLIWAFLGVRNEYQKGLTAKETAYKNYHFLKNRTSYLTRSKIKKICKMYFSNVRFCENLFLKYIRRAPILSRLSKVFLFLPLLYSTMRARVLFLSN